MARAMLFSKRGLLSFKSSKAAMSINDLDALDTQGINRADLAEYATKVVLKMVCDHGFLKTVIMIEGLGTNLDPNFQLAKVLAPYTQRLVLRQYSPALWIPRFGSASIDLARLGVELPQQLRRMLGAIEHGNLQIGTRPEGFDPLIDRFERISNRIVLGVIAAAFINGTAVLLSVYRPPSWERWAWMFFAFGFLSALVLGVYLAWTILRIKRD